MHSEKVCPFCNFHDINHQIIYEDDIVFAIVSENPINTYHVLVIPREHYESLVDLPEDVATRVFVVVQQVSRAVRIASNADAITHITEDDVSEKGFNQVRHFKFHIIPRYESDMHSMNWAPLRKEIPSSELQKIASEIKICFK